MIRKLLSIIFIFCILSSGTTIYAGDSISTPPTSTKSAITASSQGIRTGLAQKAKNIRTWAAEVKHGLEEINKNREQILQLKQKSNAAYKKAKAKVNQLLKIKDSLTNEQITTLKEAVVTLSRDKKQLDSSVGNIDSENQKLKEARMNKDLPAYKKAQQNIISIQKTRINLLKTVIEDMKKIIDM